MSGSNMAVSVLQINVDWIDFIRWEPELFSTGDVTPTLPCIYSVWTSRYFINRNVLCEAFWVFPHLHLPQHHRNGMEKWMTGWFMFVPKCSGIDSSEQSINNATYFAAIRQTIAWSRAISFKTLRRLEEEMKRCHRTAQIAESRGEGTAEGMPAFYNWLTIFGSFTHIFTLTDLCQAELKKWIRWELDIWCSHRCISLYFLFSSALIFMLQWDFMTVNYLQQ